MKFKLFYTSASRGKHPPHPSAVRTGEDMFDTLEYEIEIAGLVDLLRITQELGGGLLLETSGINATPDLPSLEIINDYRE